MMGRFRTVWRSIISAAAVVIALSGAARAQAPHLVTSSIPPAGLAQSSLLPASSEGWNEILKREPASVIEAFKAGLAQYGKKNWVVAESEFRRALAAGPRTTLVQGWLGFSLFQQARFQDAEAIFRQLASGSSAQAIDHGRVGETLIGQQKWPEAERVYRRAVELEPANPLWHYFLGVAIYAQKRVEEAETYLRRAVELEPRNALWFADFGTTQLDLGKPRNAEAAYRQAIFLRDEPSWHNGLGNALFNQGKTAAAIAELQLAIAQAPQVALYQINLGSIYTKLKKWPEAERTLRAGIALKSDQASWHALLATAFYEQQKFRDAANSYKEAIRLRPNDALSHFNLGVIHLNLGDKRSAEAELAKLKPLDQRLATKLNDLIQGKTPSGN